MAHSRSFKWKIERYVVKIDTVLEKLHEYIPSHLTSYFELQLIELKSYLENLIHSIDKSFEKENKIIESKEKLADYHHMMENYKHELENAKDMKSKKYYKKSYKKYASKINRLSKSIRKLKSKPKNLMFDIKYHEKQSKKRIKHFGKEVNRFWDSLIKAAKSGALDKKHVKWTFVSRNFRHYLERLKKF